MKTEILIIIAVSTILVIVFLSYLMISKNQNVRLEAADLTSFKRKYYCQIDFNQEKINFYSLKNITPYAFYSLADFEKIIDAGNVESWSKWLSRIRRGEDLQKEAVSLFVNQFMGYDKALVKFALRRLVKNQAYIHFDILPQMNLSASDNSEQMDTKQFARKLSSLALDLSRPTGAIICINFGMFDNLVNRYGTKIIAPYLSHLSELVARLKVGNIIKGYYSKDIYLLYKQGLVSQINITGFCQKILNHFQTTVKIDELNFDLDPYFGVLILGEFTKNITTSIKSAYEATIKGIKNDKEITYYDQDMEYKNKMLEAWRFEILNVMKKRDYVISFYPIVSLTSGNNIGRLLEVSYIGVEIKDFATLYSSAQMYNLHNDLFASALKKALMMYREKFPGETLLVFCEYKNLETFQKIYFSSQEFSDVKVSLILNDYEDLNVSKRAIQIFKDLRIHGVMLGVIAHSNMQTIIYEALHEFTFLVIPSTLLDNTDERNSVMIRAIINNIDSINLQTLAMNVNNYAMAERVKELGIDYINGPLFDERNDDIVSVRKIAKLIEGPMNKR